MTPAAGGNRTTAYAAMATAHTARIFGTMDAKNGRNPMILDVLMALLSTALLLVIVISGLRLPKSEDAFSQEQLEDWWWTCP